MTAALSHRHRKWLGWLNVLARFASVQVLIQALGFVSGILIVRHLSKPDYAWFTIANAIIGTMAALADCGVSGAVSAVGGAIWQDKAKFSSLIRTALAFRAKLAAVSAIVMTPIFIWMLTRGEASGSVIAVIVPLALLGLVLQFSANVFFAGVWFRQELGNLQMFSLAPALIRSALIALACLLFLDARIAILIGTVATGCQLFFVRRWERPKLDFHAPVSAEYRARILSIVSKQAPLTIFACLQGQISIWLISIFGNAQRVADLGALGRFTMIYSFFVSVLNGIVVPRFARCQDRHLLRRRYWQVALGYTLLAGSLVALSAAFPRLLLWVIGAQYANLEGEVWLIMLSGALGGLATSLGYLIYSKGWILPAAITIPMEIAIQTVLILSFDLSTVRGVLLVGCIGQVPLILVGVIIAQMRIGKVAPVPESLATS